MKEKEVNKYGNIGVTFPDTDLLNVAKQVAASEDRSFSAYIRQLVKSDLEKRGVIKREATRLPSTEASEPVAFQEAAEPPSEFVRQLTPTLKKTGPSPCPTCSPCSMPTVTFGTQKTKKHAKMEGKTPDGTRPSIHSTAFDIASSLSLIAQAHQRWIAWQSSGMTVRSSREATATAN